MKKPVLYSRLLLQMIGRGRRDTEPHLTKLPIRPGGVLRCCFTTWQTANVTENEGDTLLCKYCKHRLIVKDHVWQWDSDYKSEEKP